MRNLAVIALVLAPALRAEGTGGKFPAFDPRQPDVRNLGVWRLTNDPAVRDHANYHNIQCWSPNGRYTCYTRLPRKEPAHRTPAEVHVVDLHTGEDRIVDTFARNPRWATNHNWLFYAKFTNDGPPIYKWTEHIRFGIDLTRYDADTGEKVVITRGVEFPGGLDATDSWIFGVQRDFHVDPPKLCAIRVRNRPGSKLEYLRDAPNQHAFLQVNPVHPVIMTRTFKHITDRVYSRQRTLFDFDGRNHRTAFIWAEVGHNCWSSDGKYMLNGNHQIQGRLWNKPYPSDPEILSWGTLGDISPCSRSGRYLCGDFWPASLAFADIRSGDHWVVVRPYSGMIWPFEGDNSTLSDMDPKGSPDGTKIHYHSTREIENLVMAWTAKYDPSRPDVLPMRSTEGFPESGDLAFRNEVIGYKSKTPTAFVGIERRKYDTLPVKVFGLPSRRVFPLSAYLLEAKDRARSPGLRKTLRKFGQDHPLAWQRQTDCYIVVVRKPDAPHLRLKDGRVELVPGEDHCETWAYRLRSADGDAWERTVRPGETFRLPRPGRYVATAIEWCGLESAASPTLAVGQASEGRVCGDKPADFHWTREVWRVGGRIVPRREAVKAAEATREQVHLHDGVIARETWRGGRKALHVDLNADGRPIRHLFYEGGRLVKRRYTRPDGKLVSDELFGPDGFKTEYLRYSWKSGVKAVARYWWYDRGKPVKKTAGTRVVFDFTGRAGSRPSPR